MEFAEGKHVMLSYNHKSKNVVKIVYDTLKTENIPVWFDETDVDENIYDDMATGVADAAIVCCFLTPGYESSKYCKLELQQAHTLGKRIISCMVSNRKVWQPSAKSWLGLITGAILAVDFSDTSEANIRVKTHELIDRIKNQPSTHVSTKRNWFEPMKQTYLTDHKIRRVMDTGEYPIENSYINLAMVETKEQHEKEKKLKQHNRAMEDAEDKQGAKRGQYNEGILSTYEEIYGVKTSIDVKDIFEQCKDQRRKVLVLGRAGVGKSTFCQYVTYLWAKGELWQEYELVILIILRKLTSDRYPPLKTRYNYVDILEGEYFSQDGLSEGDKEAFRKQCQQSKVLWILDGYDEFVQSKPAQLVDMFDYVYKTQHHILTSRPYSVDISYDTKMEIIGFTDENIIKYAEEFSSQMTGEKSTIAFQREKLLTFLQSNPNIWGIAHIPVNLELICTMWIEPESSKADTLTVTQLYSEITEWFCRRYLEKQKKKDPCEIQNETRRTIFEDLQYCQKEMLFLEHLAYKASGENQIMIQSDLLEGIQAKTKCSGKENSQVLNMGILKSYEETNASKKKQTSKQHYFIHLSFQEYFAARHLLNLLMGPRADDGINFIKNNKYNQRYHFVFLFATGLLAEPEFQASTNIYWETIEAEPLDLIGLKHTKLMIECIDELIESNKYPQRPRHIQNICDSLRFYCSKKNRTYTMKLSESLQRATALADTTEVQSTLQCLLETNDTIICKNVLHILSNVSIQHPTSALMQQLLSLISQEGWLIYSVIPVLGKLGEKAPKPEVISALIASLRVYDADGQSPAVEALGKLGEKAATSEVISALLTALRNNNTHVRRYATEALEYMGEKAATSEVISALIVALRDKDWPVRRNAARAFGKFGEKAVTSEVISALIVALRDKDWLVRIDAARAFGKLGEKSATREVISALLTALRDDDDRTRRNAAEALGEMGDNATTTEVITALLAALRDEKEYVRRRAAEVLGKLVEKTGTSEAITALLAAIRDEKEYIRRRAAEALGKLGKKAATSEVISALLVALRDEDEDVRSNAAEALGKLVEETGTSEAITALLAALRDEKEYVRRRATEALGKIGKKAATSEVISALLAALRDENGGVRSNATEALGKLGEKAATTEVISALLAAIRDELEYVRRRAADALGKLGKKVATREVISALLVAIRDEDDRTRRNAAEALGEMGDNAAATEVITALLAALRDEKEYVRRRAAEALGKLGKKAATTEVISALLVAIRDEDGDVRSNATETIGKLGKKAATSEVTSALIAALRDEKEHVREMAARTLEELGGKAVTTECIEVLLSHYCDVEYFNSYLHKILQRALLSYDALKRLNPECIAKLCRYVEKVKNFFQGGVALYQFIRLFMDTGNEAWMRASFYVASMESIALVVSDCSIRLYDGSEPREVYCSQSELLEVFIKKFALLKQNFLNSDK